MSNNIKLKIVREHCFDPWYNLALEEKLFSTVLDDEVILYLWQNENTVVIGRNQNPWRECRYQELEADGGKLARRLSGGGAVYHDLGNLNFTFIMKKQHFDIDKQLQVIIGAVGKLGIKAEFSGRNDIVTDGKKFSGNAFYYDEDRCYHHGTLLVAADMTKLAKYLRVSKEKIESKGIKSVKSRVINLSELNPSISIDSLRAALEESFQETYEHDFVEIIDESENSRENLESSLRKNASWEWRYGQTPNFDITLYKRFVFGDLELLLNLQDGVISEVEVYSDAMDPDLALDIKELLLGIKFLNENLVSKLEDLKASHDCNMINEIQQWIMNY